MNFGDVYKIADQSGATQLIHGNLVLKLLPDSYMVAVNTMVREKSLVRKFFVARAVLHSLDGFDRCVGH